TTAQPGENGRLGWILDAMEARPEIPPLVVLHFGEETLPPVRESLSGRVHVVQVAELTEVGAVLSGALLLALPQVALGAGYEVLGALAAHLPVLHGDCEAAAELGLDAAVSAEDEKKFATALARLTNEKYSDEFARLRVCAADRSRSFSWQG